MLEIRHYITSDGRDIFLEWLRKLRDTKAKTAVVRRVNRIEQGNFGDHKHCQEGVWELRIDTGPGYCVYYAQSGETIILLLCGGDKRTQTYQRHTQTGAIGIIELRKSRRISHDRQTA